MSHTTTVVGPPLNPKSARKAVRAVAKQITRQRRKTAWLILKRAARDLKNCYFPPKIEILTLAMPEEDYTGRLVGERPKD